MCTNEMMLGLHTPGDGTANYSHFLKESQMPQSTFLGTNSLCIQTSFPIFFKKCWTNKK